MRVCLIFILRICTSLLKSSPGAPRSCSLLKLSGIYRVTLVYRRHQKDTLHPPIGSRLFKFSAISFVICMSPGKFKCPNAVNEHRLLAVPVIINSSDSQGIFSRGGQALVALRLYLVMDTAGARCTRTHTQTPTHSLLA